jgi:hypothetical protein
MSFMQPQSTPFYLGSCGEVMTMHSKWGGFVPHTPVAERYVFEKLLVHEAITDVVKP